ncbi:MAG: hypothetical protein ABI797_03585 [Chloroflexota bacterium]
MLRHRRVPSRLTIAAASATTVGLLLTLPEVVLAHTLNERYQSPLPLVAYVGAAALAVAMSFAFVMLRNPPAPRDDTVTEPRPAPRWLRLGLRSVGLLAWVWIVVQTVVGGSGDGDVASLFLWVYGWVGLALVSALIGPAWAWLDPFATIHELLSGFGKRLGISTGQNSDYPERLGRWPAVIGFAVIVWLELVAHVEGGRSLGLFMIGYTVFTVGAMSYFGREAWRTKGEIFSVWFDVLGRLAPFALDGPPTEGRLRRRPFASGLLSKPWSTAEVTLLALATGAIIYDGLSQTTIYHDLFVASGALSPAILRESITAGVFLAAVVGMVLIVARRLGNTAIGAGLLPVAVGYLVAHYLAYMLIDGQRILAALNDPLLRGSNLLPLDLGFWEPTLFLPTSVLWSIQLAAVVGGHILGAWSGHAAMAQRESGRTIAAQLPLAALMVILTTITLWSLGQAVLVETAG